MFNPPPHSRLEWRTVSVALDSSGDGTAVFPRSSLPGGATSLAAVAVVGSALDKFDAVTLTQDGGRQLYSGAVLPSSGPVYMLVPLVPETGIDVSVSGLGASSTSTAYVSLQFLIPG